MVAYSLPELHQLELLLRSAPALVQSKVLGLIDFQQQQLPIYAITVGNAAPDKPVLLLTAGVHGLERIGTQVLLAFLEGLCSRLQWDPNFADLFEKVQLCLLPLINPSGMVLGWRSNQHHVDLMRNAPIDAQEAPPFLVGGQRISATLPWYRGPAGRTGRHRRPRAAPSTFAAAPG